MDIASWLSDAVHQLSDAGIQSARLDAELILAETLEKPRTYLHAHADDFIDPQRNDIANARLILRKDRVPLAYIQGKKEFYGRTFAVSPKVLIPRPESEMMIALFLEYTPHEVTHKTLIDVGTGSGCLGITAALERPLLQVTLSDISRDALAIAQKNAAALHATVRLHQQSLLSEQAEPVDYIFANLPYVNEAWETSPELIHEPRLALYAKDNGLSCISQLLKQAPQHLHQSGLLFIEADPEQHQQIIAYAKQNSLDSKTVRGYCCVFQKRR